MTALAECLPMFPKTSVMNAGIAHHFRASGYGKHVVIAVATPKESDAWEKQIAAELKTLPPQARWWRGTDVGKSSAALFHVFCDQNWKYCSKEVGQAATPIDAADFGRCKRLIDLIPEWRNRLGEVSAQYPDTAWPRIIERWQEIESAKSDRVNEILRECHTAKCDSQT